MENDGRGVFRHVAIFQDTLDTATHVRRIEKIICVSEDHNRVRPNNYKTSRHPIRCLTTENHSRTTHTAQQTIAHLQGQHPE